jgi:hypothetical protein
MAKTVKKWRKTPRESLRKWTVMVYMAAENSAELDGVAIEDLREMEQGANEDVHVVVQINRAWPASPQRYQIGRPKSELLGVDLVSSNMGSGETLARFLTWAAEAFPADNYCLVLWGHAFGLGFGRDHNDSLTLTELKTALDKFRSVSPNERKLDLLGTNACAMSYVEAAYELQDSASYMVASQIAVPFAGWPYKTILSRIGQAKNAEALGRLIVDAYVTHYNALLSGERVAMSLLKLEEAGILQTALQELAGAIKDETSPEGQFSSRKLDYVRDVFIGAAAGDVRPLIDLRDLCQGFDGAESKALRRLSADVPALLKKLVVHHDEHSDLDDLHGIGIFAPFVTDDHDLRQLGLQVVDPEGDSDGSASRAPDRKKTGKEEYKALSIFKGMSDWPSLVYDELRREIPSEVMTSLTAVGATKREDRRDIAQIVLSIDSSFNKLDRILDDARTCVAKELEAAKEERETDRTGPPDGKARKGFGPPWLKLIQPPDLETRVATLKQLAALRELERAATNQVGAGTSARAAYPGSVTGADIDLPASPLERGDPLGGAAAHLVDSVVDFFDKIEKAVGGVERATKKGLTHARFGLGPTAPGQFSVGEPTTFSGERPKSGKMGDSGERPKSGKMGGSDEDSSPLVVLRGDLRVDLAFARVVELFRQVGQVLLLLEQAALEVETTARDTLANAQIQNLSRKDLLRAASGDIDRAFRILQEASTNARRTVRHVLAHPVYGMGPTSGTVGLEERQALASAGGVDRRTLRLL